MFNAFESVRETRAGSVTVESRRPFKSTVLEISFDFIPLNTT